MMEILRDFRYSNAPKYGTHRNAGEQSRRRARTGDEGLLGLRICAGPCEASSGTGAGGSSRARSWQALLSLNKNPIPTVDGQNPA